MSNITVRKENGRKEITPGWFGREVEPLRVMRDLLRWDPFREMLPLPTEDRLAGFAPAFEVKETKEAFVFKADVPGVKENDLDVTVTGNRLTVSGKRESEEEHREDTYYAYERSFGSFSRAFTLPEGADTEHVRAEMKDGILTLAVPKKPALLPKKIDVKSGQAVKS